MEAVKAEKTITDLSVCMCVQYGGSEAHSTFFQRQRGDWEAATQSRDIMTSIRRFYSNAYTDAEKQDAINLFLGNFVPHHGHAALWELDSDYFLHAGQQFSKPPSRPIIPPAVPSSQLPSSSLAYHSSSLSAHQAEIPSVAPLNDDSQQPETSDAHMHRQPSHGSPASSQHSDSIMLPQLQNVDLENVEKVCGAAVLLAGSRRKYTSSVCDGITDAVHAYCCLGGLTGGRTCCTSGCACLSKVGHVREGKDASH
ncbi:TPA: hypothetical protein ACH3X2_004820 [Trebouxia sp. C0005]